VRDWDGDIVITPKPDASEVVLAEIWPAPR
jgi:hypothetical protein